MAVRSLFGRLFLTVVLCAGADSASAQEALPPIQSEQPSAAELLRRLEQAEQRIRSLESELKKTTTTDVSFYEDKKEDKKEDADKELEKRLKKLEDEYRKQKEAAEKKKAEDAKKNPSAEINGRIHLDSTSFLNDSRGIGFLEHPDDEEANFGTDPENRLFFRRLRLTVSGEVLDNMIYKLDLEFGEPEEIGFRDAYLGFENLPGNHTLFIGNQKRPYSLDDLNSSNVNVFMERPLMSQSFGDEDRRIGVALHGYSDDESLNWAIGVFELENVATTGTYIDDPFQGSVNARLSGTPYYDECSGGRSYLHLGISNMIAWPNGFADDADGSPNQAHFRSRPELRSTSRWVDTGRIEGADWFNILGLEAALNLGPFSLVGEYMGSWVGRETRPGFDNPGSDLFFHGCYVYAGYFLTGEAQSWDRKRGVLGRVKPFENFFLVERLCGGHGNGWGAWQVAARYSFVNLSDRDIRGGRENNLTLGLNWWWNPHARVMLNYVLGEIDNHRPVEGFTEGSFSGLAMRFHIDW